MDRFKSILSWLDKKGEINFFVIKKIEKLNYLGDFNMFNTDLTFYLAKDINDIDIKILVFKNITSLKLDLSINQLAGLVVDDISDRGFEKCKYRIYSYESNDIDFYFEDFEIKNNAT